MPRCDHSHDDPGCAWDYRCARDAGHEGEHRNWLTHDEARAQGIPQATIDAAVAETDFLLRNPAVWWRS